MRDRFAKYGQVLDIYLPLDYYTRCVWAARGRARRRRQRALSRVAVAERRKASEQTGGRLPQAGSKALLRKHRGRASERERARARPVCAFARAAARDNTRACHQAKRHGRETTLRARVRDREGSISMQGRADAEARAEGWGERRLLKGRQVCWQQRARAHLSPPLLSTAAAAAAAPFFCPRSPHPPHPLHRAPPHPTHTTPQPHPPTHQQAPKGLWLYRVCRHARRRRRGARPRRRRDRRPPRRGLL